MFFQLASTNVPQVFGRYARRCSRRPRTDHPQNTEDEVLKAAIAKYGKNQWYAPFLSPALPPHPFSGLVYPLFSYARPQNSARHAGTNGLIRPSRKQNGRKCVLPPPALTILTRLFRPKMRSSCTLQSSCPPNGAP